MSQDPFPTPPARLIVSGLLAIAVAVALPASAAGQDRERFSIEVEGGPVWQTRNDIRVPNEGGTDFSLVDTIGKGPSPAI